MSFAFMPIYTGDYLRDTQHLDCAEHGIYFKFLMYCWDQKGPLPRDERKLQGICNARSGSEIEAMRRIVSEFFVGMEDGFYNRRMQLEVERAENLSNKRSKAGFAGYQAKAKLLNKKNVQAIAKQVPSNCQASASTPTPTPTLTPTPTKSRGTRFVTEAPPGSWIEFCRQERPDLDPASTYAKFADYWAAKAGRDGVKLDWFATWRNWVRAERSSASKPGKLTAAGMQTAQAAMNWLSKKDATNA